MITTPPTTVSAGLTWKVVPANGVTWGNPCMFRNSRDGAYFDYLLVRGDRDPIAEAPPGPSWELIGSARAFHLYRRAAGESRPGEEDHSA